MLSAGESKISRSELSGFVSTNYTVDPSKVDLLVDRTITLLEEHCTNVKKATDVDACVDDLLTVDDAGGGLSKFTFEESNLVGVDGRLFGDLDAFWWGASKKYPKDAAAAPVGAKLVEIAAKGQQLYKDIEVAKELAAQAKAGDAAAGIALKAKTSELEEASNNLFRELESSVSLTGSDAALKTAVEAVVLAFGVGSSSVREFLIKAEMHAQDDHPADSEVALQSATAALEAAALQMHKALTAAPGAFKEDAWAFSPSGAFMLGVVWGDTKNQYSYEGNAKLSSPALGDDDKTQLSFSLGFADAREYSLPTDLDKAQSTVYTGRKPTGEAEKSLTAMVGAGYDLIDNFRQLTDENLEKARHHLVLGVDAGFVPQPAGSPGLGVMPRLNYTAPSLDAGLALYIGESSYAFPDWSGRVSEMVGGVKGTVKVKRESGLQFPVEVALGNIGGSLPKAPFVFNAALGVAYEGKDKDPASKESMMPDLQGYAIGATWKPVYVGSEPAKNTLGQGVFVGTLKYVNLSVAASYSLNRTSQSQTLIGEGADGVEEREVGSVVWAHTAKLELKTAPIAGHLVLSAAQAFTMFDIDAGGGTVPVTAFTVAFE